MNPFIPTWCRSYKAPARANRAWSMNLLDGSSRSHSIFVHAMQTPVRKRAILRVLLIAHVVGGAYPEPDDAVRDCFMSQKVTQSKFEVTPAYSAFFVALFDVVVKILRSWSTTYRTEKELADAWRTFLERSVQGRNERDLLYKRATEEAAKVLEGINAFSAAVRSRRPLLK
jgi:hypothetical protein